MEYGFDGEYNQFTIFDVIDFEVNSKKYDAEKTLTRGKIFILEKDTNNSRNIDINDLKWPYFDDNGDFHSDEVKA